MADRCFGKVLDALKQSGREEDTLVIYTTDHGIAFPNMKCNLYDTGIGVSLIIKYPGNPMRGRGTDALVSHIDLFPTICDFAGVKRPDWLQGHSLHALFEGKAEKVRDEVFSEVTYHAAYEPMRCIRTERYKLIRIYEEHETRVPANIDDSLSKSFMVKHGLLGRRRPKNMLFDLYLDPMERENLMDNVQYQSIYKELDKRLTDWQKATSDPILNGRVPKPEGAVVNTFSCASPNDRDYEV
ncbi:MAG: sulfatase/phosphatase domain-containing protein [Eubacteriales bacterium]